MAETKDLQARFARAKFRAWHRGTREADFLIGGFFDRYCKSWTPEDLAWFESVLDEDDVEVMAWACKSLPVPEKYSGHLMDLMQRLDYVDIPR